MYQVFLHGLEVYGYHGVSDEEQAVGHRYVADLTLDVNGKADRTDRIADTVSYADLADLVAEQIGKSKCRTVEKLASKVCDAVLKAFPAVQGVNICLAKRLPPLPHVAEVAGVEITMTRKG